MIGIVQPNMKDVCLPWQWFYEEALYKWCNYLFPNIIVGRDFHGGMTWCPELDVSYWNLWNHPAMCCILTFVCSYEGAASYCASSAPVDFKNTFLSASRPSCFWACVSVLRVLSNCNMHHITCSTTDIFFMIYKRIVQQ